MTQEEIIQKLFEARVTSRMTQVDLGLAAGYHESQILRAERGKLKPKLQQVCDMATALGLELVLRPKQ